MVTAENIADFGVVHSAFSAITHLNYFLLFGPYNGIHKVSVDFCSCKFRVPDRVQCLRYSWYPATTQFSQMCMTMAVLKHFHMQTLCGKVSMYEYYHGLNHLTDNTEVNLPKVSSLVPLFMSWC